MARIDGEIIIAAPVEQVFDTVADERNEPRYNPRIARVQKTSPGPVGRGTRFSAQPKGMGARGVMTIQLVDYDRPRRLATSIRSSTIRTGKYRNRRIRVSLRASALIPGGSSLGSRPSGVHGGT